MGFYIIKDLSPALNGLVIEGELNGDKTSVVVNKLVNRNAVFGDRSIVYPLPDSALSVGVSFLGELDNPALREFDSKRPFGKCLFEGAYTKDSLKVAYAQYEEAMQVTVLEVVNNRTKTIFSGYFPKEKIDIVRGAVEECLCDDVSADDLFFELDSLLEKGDVK